MVQSGIMRQPSNEEAADYAQVGRTTPKMVFMKKLDDKKTEYSKEFKPFDEQCARLDYADEVERIERESQRSIGYVDANAISNIDFGDFGKYGGDSRFELVRDDEDVEMQNINNVKTAIKIGHTIQYKCKNRGHGISVFMPTSVYEEKFLKKVVKEDK